MVVTQSDETKLGMISSSLQISQYMRSRKDYDLIVFYEDILSDKEKVCKELLKVCDIPSNYEPDVSDF